MTDVEIAVQFTEHTQKIDTLTEKVQNFEAQTEKIQDLVMSVRELTTSIDSMLKQMQDQNDRLKELETAPVRMWSNTKKTFFTAITSTIAGGLAVAIIQILSQYVGG